MDEITVFTYGDSALKSTWSNVPFYLTDSFIRLGFKVNRVNLKPNKYLLKLWNQIVLRLIRTVLPNSTYTFDRTPFFRVLARRKMKRSVSQYSNSKFFLSTSFSFHPGRYTNRPVVMFCDWTYQYYLQHFLHRKPDFLEAQEIRNQHELQASVDMMISLFPDVRDYIVKKENCDGAQYLGNVINSDMYDSSDEIIKSKYLSNSIVFIGLPKYLPGLISLLKAVAMMAPLNHLTVNVIGVTENQVPKDLIRTNVTFWGYLDKSNHTQNQQYYEVVNNAKLFVNTNPEWASFSATLDVMYHSTPVVTSGYRSFVRTFGKSIDFGEYCDNDPELLAKLLNKIFNLSFEDYVIWCNNARKAVEPFTWDNYVKRIIDELYSRQLISL